MTRRANSRVCSATWLTEFQRLVQWPASRRSSALIIGRHRQLGLTLGLSLGRNEDEFTGAILDCSSPELVILTLRVELDARADTDVVGNIGRPDCIGECLGIGPVGALERIGSS